MSQDPSPTPVLRGRHRTAVTDPGSNARDTRARIQEVALELFISEGYDKTSLREIAERLGVTKAALYYHFPTKDDIVSSLIEDRIARVEELVAWARTQPPTLETKRELLRRYSGDLHKARHHEVMQFLERNPTAIKAMPAGQRMRELMMQLGEFLSDPAEPLHRQIRCSMALFAVHATWFILRDPSISDDDKREAALRVAFDLVEGD
jgi:AcrR family transcriptional regulator